MDEYEWTGAVDVVEGRAHKRGEVLILTKSAAATMLKVGAIELRSDAEARRAADAKAETKAAAAAQPRGSEKLGEVKANVS